MSEILTAEMVVFWLIVGCTLLAILRKVART